MNKLLLSAALAAVIGAVAFAPQAANAASTTSGTITINGSVVASTCNVAVNGSASPTITLPTVVNTMLPTTGSSGGWTAVNMVLTGCTAITGSSYTSVYPYFTGSQIDSSTGYLKNATSGGSNVEVALSNGQSTTGALTLAGAANAQNAGTLGAAANGSFNYYAGYVATAGAASVGGVSTTVQYALNYQ